MLVNLTKVFQGEEKDKQLTLEFDFSGEDISCDATFEQPVKAELNLRKGIVLFVSLLVTPQQCFPVGRGAGVFIHNVVGKVKIFRHIYPVIGFKILVRVKLGTRQKFFQHRHRCKTIPFRYVLFVDHG